jgi:hypothetical protein
MARVYKAIDVETHESVAVKVLTNALNPDQRLLALKYDREFRSLERLRHENIVQLLDVGRDDETSEPFFVFPWLEQTLDAVLANSPPEGWDTFADEFALPILRGLAYAHGEKIVHRDIKPNNILIDSSGAPLIADFGIAKLKTEFRPGLTLAEFQTRPFAPREWDDGEYSYTRDVHSFGVLVALALTGVDFTADRFREDPYQALDEARCELDVPADVDEFLATCYATEPGLRPINAAVALAQIEQIQARRRGVWKRPDACFIKLGAKVRDQMMGYLEVDDAREVEKAICQDLSGEPGFEPMKARDGEEQRETTHLSLYGAEFRYHVARDRATKDRFFVFGVWPQESSLLERRREAAFRPLLDVRVGEPPNRSAAKQFHDGLEERLQQFLAERMLAEREQERMRIMWTWKSTLDAMGDLEREREAPIEYVEREQVGQRLEFTLKQVPGEDLEGYFRQVKLDGGGYLSGEVIAVRGRVLSLLPEYGQPERVPARGLLRVDTWPARKAILGQRSALDALIYNRALRSDLGDLLMEPERARDPKPVAELEFRNENLDEPKRRAVKAALGARDLLLVQGPPGTGKTTFITELVLQELARNPKARILIASQTHAALDNVLERLARTKGELRLLRIARLGDPRVSDQVAEYLLDRQLAKWREGVIKQGRQYLRQWAKEQGISERSVEISVLYEELARIRAQLESINDEVSEADKRLGELRERAAADRRETSEDISDLESRRQGLQTMASDSQALFDAAVTRLTDLRELQTPAGVGDITAEDFERRAADAMDRVHPAFQRCRDLIAILGDWHTRFGRADEFHGAVLLRSNVVAATCLGLRSVKGADAIEFDLCIVDEASKASATELLVPMVRARRWVLVGDPKQLPPFVEHTLLAPALLAQHELSEADVRQTLFELVWTRLPPACRTKLTVQHRMVSEIGDLISACFYDDELENGAVEPLPSLGLVLPRPVTWFTTATLDHRDEREAGTSKANPAEARFIKRLLGRLDFYANGVRRELSVAILTGYQGQQELIEREISYALRDLTHLKRVECMTVNSFQGREADIAVYSVTRCNKEGKLGFVRDPPHLNVALSRGRFGLAIVGDHVFMQTAREGDNPFHTVLDWIRAHPDQASIVDVDR